MADDDAPASAPGRGRRGLGADAQAAQVVGELVGARVELAVGELLVAEAHGEGVGVAERPGPRRGWWTSGGRGQLAPVPDSSPRGAAGARPAVSSGSSDEAATRASDATASSSTRRCSAMRDDGGGVEQVRVVVEAADAAPRALREGQREVELGDAGVELHGRSASSPGRRVARSRACSAARTSPGRAGVWLRSRSGWSSSTSFSKGRSWCA